MSVADRKAGRVQATNAELRQALKAARIQERTETKIVSATYDRRRDVVLVGLSTGSSLGVPKRAIVGFANAPSGALTELEITPGGAGLWSDLADDGVLLEQLLIIVAGKEMLGTIGARINASKKSAARAAASRKKRHQRRSTAQSSRCLTMCKLRSAI